MRYLTFRVVYPPRNNNEAPQARLNRAALCLPVPSTAQRVHSVGGASECTLLCFFVAKRGLDPPPPPTLCVNI
jgi:hypothetical protein